MLGDKGTNIFSEIGKFFKENDATSAMNAIIDMTKTFRLSEKRLFGSESKCNCKLTQLQVLGLLMLFPCFMIRNAYNYGKSSLSCLFDCRKDVFYRFISNESYDWRKILATVSLQLWNKTQEKRTTDSAEPVCLMVDDTDYPKRGIQTELIGKIYSHVTHSMMLGFKGLFIGITDGISQILLDFAIVGEEGKKGNYGLKQEQLDARFSKEHDKESHTAKRIKEYNQSKIALMIEMIRRIIKRKIRFDYVLADSWFACADVIKFITSRHVSCHYLGMIKMGKTRYIYKGKEYTANQLAALFDKPKKGRSYSRRLGCWYITVDVIFAGRNVRLFFCKRGKWAKWNGLITTNKELDFFEAYRIYSMRWSLEVVFKESKQNLGLGKYQMRNFSSQIAMTAITAMQYNLLSTAKRFSDYETVGGLFNDAVKGSVELTLTERIWDMILEMVRMIAECFNIEDEEIFDMLLNRSDKLKHFVELYQFKLAS
jgi:hypothetical protein